MGTPREKQKKNNQQMAEKVKIIYEMICQSDIMKLVKLLSNANLLKKNSQYPSHRKKALKNILKNETASKQYFEDYFQDFYISNLYIEDKPVFEKEFFLNSDIKVFRERVIEYMEYYQNQKIDIDRAYRYIYMYDHSKFTEDNHNVNNLMCYEVKYAEVKNIDIDNGLKIKVYPPENKSERGEYEGIIKKREKQLILIFENRYDSVHIIFNTSLAGASGNTLFDEKYYGVAIGINDINQQTPVAKKVVFSKHKFSFKEKAQLYLMLNETQKIEANENIYALERVSQVDADYLSKYHQNIKDIHTFFSNVKYSKEIDTTIMHHMVFTEFHVFQTLFEKFAQKQDYYLHDRKRVFLEFMRFLQAHPGEKVQMVFPLYLKNENIFEYHEPGKVTPKDILINLAKEGMCFEIIFIVEKSQDYQNNTMQKIFHELDEVGISLSFAAKRVIEFDVGSCDFCYTSSMRDAIFKSRLRNKKMFTITQNRELIKNLVQDFEFIKLHSYNYQQVQKDDLLICIKDPILKKLLGRWFLYFYGSYTYQDGKPVFWEISFDLKSDYTVIGTGMQSALGIGKVEIAPQQTLLYTISKEIQNSFYVVITNNNIADIMQVLIYSKQEQSRLDMAVVAIASREKLMSEEAQMLLGTPSECVLKVDPYVQMRIDQFIIAHKGVKPIDLK